MNSLFLQAAPPESGNAGTAAVLAGALAVIMFTMGLELRLEDFARVFRQTRAVATGLVLQMVFLPLLALALVKLLNVPPWTAAGLWLVAVCPGGTTSNFLSYLLKADAALSVSLTAVNSVLTLFSIPLLLAWGLPAIAGADAPQLGVNDMLNMSWQLLVVAIVPMGLGMLVLGRNARLAGQLLRVFKVLATVLFVAIVVGAVLKNRAQLGQSLEVAALPLLLLCVLAVATGWLGAALLRLPPPQQATIAIEVGLQNATLAILLAEGVLQPAPPELTFVPAGYGLLMYATMPVFALLWNWRRRLWLKKQA